jgi:hypothetical protein
MMVTLAFSFLICACPLRSSSYRLLIFTTQGPSKRIRFADAQLWLLDYAEQHLTEHQCSACGTGSAAQGHPRTGEFSD